MRLLPLTQQALSDDAGQLYLATAAGPPAPGAVNGLTVLVVGFCFLVPMVWIYVVRQRVSRGALARLTTALTVLSLWFVGASTLAYSAGVLTYLGTAELESHPEAWQWTAVSPLVALFYAWWFGRDFPRPRVSSLLVRAGLLYGACLVAVLLAVHTGLPVFSGEGVGNLLAFTATLVCIVTWQLIDRLRPAQLLVRAGWVLAVCVAVVWLALANDVQIMADPRTATGVGLLVTVGLIALLVLAGSVACIGAWRLINRHRRPLRRQARPRPGEIWNAEVPFEDNGSESKDRPVLVVRVSGDHAAVMKITSQDKSRFDNYLHLPHARWRKVLTKDSWLDLATTDLPLRNFRSLRGRCRPDVWRAITNGDLPRNKPRGITEPELPL